MAEEDRPAEYLRAAVDQLRDQRRTYEGLLGSIWLYIPWYDVTKQLTTPQKELFADAVDGFSRRLNDGDPESAGGPADRWWRDA